MKKLMQKPCDNCPYVLGSQLCKFLHEYRKEEFWESHIEKGEAFYCHKTCEESEEGFAGGRDSTLCFGALAVQWKEKGGFTSLAAFAHQMLGGDPEELYREAECPESLEDWKKESN